MSKNRQSSETAEPPSPLRPLDGPTRHELAHRERIERHHHTVHQLIYPSDGVLHVSTPEGIWVVPPLRGVWIPAGVAHSHQAHGPTRMRALAFPASADPLPARRPMVLAVSPLLREVVIALTDDLTDRRLDRRHRRNLERVALDQLRGVDALPLHLPVPTDPRLAEVAGLLAQDPGDRRSLARLGAAVGASERTLSRLFRAQTGMTFPQWRTQLRLHHSLTLLATGASVTTTAATCGYANTSAFIESFRHAFGTTPGHYYRQA